MSTPNMSISVEFFYSFEFYIILFVFSIKVTFEHSVG